MSRTRFRQTPANREQHETDNKIRAGRNNLEPAFFSPRKETMLAKRELTSHRVNECNESINVLVMDDPGCGGACHHYRIEPITLPGDHPEGAINPCEIRFQNGPIAEVGVNGVTHEALLAVLEDRLSSFQDGPYACQENVSALIHIRSAQEWLRLRTLKRIGRGVEGTHQV